jgi:basic membrane protein A
LHFKIPFFERVAKVVSLKEQVVDFPPQPVITKDNVSVKVDSVVFSKVFDPQKYTYGVENPIAGLQNLSATTLRSIIGGMELDTTKAKYQGYAEAAAYVGEKAGKTVKTLDIVYSNSFSASDKGIEFAKAMIDQGADVFFGDASAVDSGARQAIDEANAAAGSVKIYDIAQPADILGQNECIITSQVTDNSSLVGLSMQAVMNGTFGGEVIYGTLQNGVLSAGRISDLVPAEVQTQFKAYIDEMIAGTFMK